MIDDADIPDDDGASTMKAEAQRMNIIQGLPPRYPTRNSDQVEVAIWIEAGLMALRMATHPSEIDEWFTLNERYVDILRNNHPDEHAELLLEAGDIRDGLSARL